ncbi:aspartate/glutamate racemase family protein [Ferrimonas marina]|uniref:Aspartate racemase n=1 Tax=Ferrimonas marina TaxID=299255 RepID=A0A1M5VPA1_9GAMM|nr:amino acid racemase [Ferrimonas marina]SHH77008.1 aspartate racemase [Ferrimonas marina]
MKEILFGVMGNMGPEADALFQDILAKEEIKAGAMKDQDHMGVVVVKNPDIPDRSEAINEGGQDPVPEMVKSAQAMERLGVQFAVMTCNTAHYFREAVQAHTDVYLVDMLKATSDRIKAKDPESVVGVLCTNGTYNSGIYDRYLQASGLVFVKPSPEVQEHCVHSAIYGEVTGEKSAGGQALRQPNGIKSGVFEPNAERLIEAINKMEQQGVNTVILGCTELPLVRGLLEQRLPHIHFVDPMEVIATDVIEVYKQAEALLNSGLLSSVPRQVMAIANNRDLAGYVAAQAAQRRERGG